MQSPELTLRIIVADSSDNNGLPGEVTSVTLFIPAALPILLFADHCQETSQPPKLGSGSIPHLFRQRGRLHRSQHHLQVWFAPSQIPWTHFNGHRNGFHHVQSGPGTQTQHTCSQVHVCQQACILAARGCVTAWSVCLAVLQHANNELIDAHCVTSWYRHVQHAYTHHSLCNMCNLMQEQAQICNWSTGDKG